MRDLYGKFTMTRIINMNSNTIILATLLSIGFSLSANAAGLKDKKRFEAATVQVETVKKEAEEMCGTKFDFSFDKESFTPSDLDDKGMNGYCGDVFAGMKDLCADDDYKKAMATVKSVSCSFDKSLEKPSTKMADGKVTFSFNWDTANHRRLAKEFLENNL